MKNKISILIALAMLALPLVQSCSSTSTSSDSSAKILHEEDLVKARAGDAEAQCSVGYDYEVGSGVAQDMREAEKWYRKAAEQGYVDGQIELTHMYAMDGAFANEKPEECYYWAQKVYHNPNATDFHKVFSGSYLHRCYDKGYGVEKNPEKSAEWKAKYLADYQRDLRNHRKSAGAR